MNKPDLQAQILDALPFAVFTVNKDYEITFSNQKFVEMFQNGNGLNKYFGEVLGCCNYLKEKKSDNTMFCKYCQFKSQINKAFETSAPNLNIDFVKELMIGGSCLTKLLNIDTIPLSNHEMLVLIRDVSPE